MLLTFFLLFPQIIFVAVVFFLLIKWRNKIQNPYPIYICFELVTTRLCMETVYAGENASIQFIHTLWSWTFRNEKKYNSNFLNQNNNRYTFGMDVVSGGTGFARIAVWTYISSQKTGYQDCSQKKSGFMVGHSIASSSTGIGVTVDRHCVEALYPEANASHSLLYGRIYHRKE
jgi:hypothetical protein